MLAKVDDEAAEKSLTRTERKQLLRERLQDMLANRFHLRVHHGTKMMEVLDLVTNKGGPKLGVSAKNDGYSTSWGAITCSSTTMDEFAVMLATQLQTFVVNQTKLDGPFSFKLRWDTQDKEDSLYPFPSLAGSMADQLGLRLVPARGPVDVIVVDHVEPPSSN